MHIILYILHIFNIICNVFAVCMNSKKHESFLIYAFVVRYLYHIPSSNGYSVVVSSDIGRSPVHACYRPPEVASMASKLLLFHQQ